MGWVKQADWDLGGGLNSEERWELAGLHRENLRLREEVGMLKRAGTIPRRLSDYGPDPDILRRIIVLQRRASTFRRQAT
jgi:hypothetical protein